MSGQSWRESKKLFARVQELRTEETSSKTIDYPKCYTDKFDDSLSLYHTSQLDQIKRIPNECSEGFGLQRLLRFLNQEFWYTFLININEQIPEDMKEAYAPLISLGPCEFEDLYPDGPNASVSIAGFLKYQKWIVAAARVLTYEVMYTTKIGTKPRNYTEEQKQDMCNLNRIYYEPMCKRVLDDDIPFTEEEVRAILSFPNIWEVGTIFNEYAIKQDWFIMSPSEKTYTLTPRITEDDMRLWAKRHLEQKTYDGEAEYKKRQQEKEAIAAAAKEKAKTFDTNTVKEARETRKAGKKEKKEASETKNPPKVIRKESPPMSLFIRPSDHEQMNAMVGNIMLGFIPPCDF